MAAAVFGNKSVNHKELKKRNFENQPDSPELYLLLLVDLQFTFQTDLFVCEKFSLKNPFTELHLKGQISWPLVFLW